MYSYMYLYSNASALIAGRGLPSHAIHPPSATHPRRAAAAAPHTRMHCMHAHATAGQITDIERSTARRGDARGAEGMEDSNVLDLTALEAASDKSMRDRCAIKAMSRSPDGTRLVVGGHHMLKLVRLSAGGGRAAWTNIRSGKHRCVFIPLNPKSVCLAREYSF